MSQPDDTIELPLSRGLVAVVDADAPPEVTDHKWTFIIGHNGKRYVCRKVKQGDRSVTVYLHRVILGLTDPRQQGDHIDGNGLNNRRANLRVATNQQNLRNRGKNRNNTSGYKGVSPLPDGRWAAFIKVDRRHRNLGAYETAEAAARVYDRAAHELFAEFAHFNFPEDYP